VSVVYNIIMYKNQSINSNYIIGTVLYILSKGDTISLSMPLCMQCKYPDLHKKSKINKISFTYIIAVIPKILFA
jgi:hypothetical protein